MFYFLIIELLALFKIMQIGYLLIYSEK